MALVREDNYRGIDCVWLESAHLSVGVAPQVGGRIISLRHRPADYEFLWCDADKPLRLNEPGSEYDPNFYGGIDELLPNDLPESIGGIELPDHGELWTSSLAHRIEADALILSGKLPRSGLEYRRAMTLADGEPRIDFHYRIENTRKETLPLLWKMHAALRICPGDRIVCPAGKAKAADLAYSRWTSGEPFAWPHAEGGRADIVPPKSDKMDFLYLYELREGCIGLENRAAGMLFEYHFDLAVLPVCWLFASYGGFFDSYTAILEPCTTMPMSVNEALDNGVTAVLQPGEALETGVSIYAGPR